MAQIDFVKLSAQGRSFDATRSWTEDELVALLEIESCGVDRRVAANYVRNGITTKAQYEKAQAVGFTPKSLDELRAEAIAAHQEKVREALGDVLEVSEPEVEVVDEPEVVSEPDVVVEPEVVVETADEVVEPDVVPEPEEVVEPEAVAPVVDVKFKSKKK